MLDLVKASKEKTCEFSNEQIANFIRHLHMSVVDPSQSEYLLGLVKEVDRKNHISETITFVPSRQDKDVVYLIKVTAQKTTSIALSLPVLLSRYLAFHEDEILECLLKSLVGVGLHGAVFNIGYGSIRVKSVDFVEPV